MSERKFITKQLNLNSFDLDDKVELILGDNYEIKIENGRTYIINKNSNYPKDFEECCNILGIDPKNIKIDVPEPYKNLMENLTKLIICRDAYWKLVNDWKPKYNSFAYVIYYDESGKLVRGGSNCIFEHLLAFPTPNMTDHFLNKFIKYINPCKKFI